MPKKYLTPTVLFLVGLVMSILGSLFKIMHWTGATVLFISGMLTIAVSLIILIVVLLNNKKP